MARTTNNLFFFQNSGSNMSTNSIDLSDSVSNESPTQRTRKRQQSPKFFCPLCEKDQLLSLMISHIPACYFLYVTENCGWAQSILCFCVVCEGTQSHPLCNNCIQNALMTVIQNRRQSLNNRAFDHTHSSATNSDDLLTQPPSQSPLQSPSLSPSQSPLLSPSQPPSQTPSQSPLLSPSQSPSQSPLL